MEDEDKAEKLSEFNVGLDVVSRLRDGNRYKPNHWTVMVEAADEIERLRTLARDAYAAWDSDKDARVGKLLIAMLDENFSKKYRPDLTPNAELSGEQMEKLNALELAASTDNPAANGYVEKRNALYGYVCALEKVDTAAPVAWRRTDTSRSVITENEDIARGWAADGLFFEPLYAGALLGPWKPIETAPKDGTEILLACAIGALSDIGLCYWRSDNVMVGWTWGLGKAFGHPTHWMPLPVVPNA